MSNSNRLKVCSTLLAAFSLVTFAAEASLPLPPPSCPESRLDPSSSKELSQLITDDVASDNWMAHCAANALTKRGRVTLPILIPKLNFPG